MKKKFLVYFEDKFDKLTLTQYHVETPNGLKPRYEVKLLVKDTKVVAKKEYKQSSKSIDALFEAYIQRKPNC